MDSPILCAGRPSFDCNSCLAGDGFSPPPCSTRSFSCKGVRCHLATMSPSHFGPKIDLCKDAAAEQPLDTVSQLQQWNLPIALHLSMTRRLAANIPRSAERFGRTSLVNWKDLKGRGGNGDLRQKAALVPQTALSSRQLWHWQC